MDDGLPEDQQDEDDSQSRSSTSSQESDMLENRAAAGSPVVGPAAYRGAAGVSVMMEAAEPALLLRHPSISSLDEPSQKYKALVTAARMSSSEADSLSPTYKNPLHPLKALDGFRALRDANLLTDVTLVAGDVQLQAHRTLLAACSPYFNAMFTGFGERYQDKVTLLNVDATALKILLDYVYTGQVQVTEDNVQALLPAANLLQLTDVRDACCEFLQGQLHPTNCLGIRAFADLHGCLELLNVANAYSEAHFCEVLDCDEFYALTADQVADLISKDTITVPGEERVYESLMSWVKHSPADRNQYLPCLMEHVRLPLLTKEYLLQLVDGDRLFPEHSACKDFLIEALKFHLAGNSDTRQGKWSKRTQPRQPLSLPKVLLAIGGQAPKAIRSVECYDFKEDRWLHLSEMPTRRCRCGVAVIRGRIFVVGGFNGSLRVRTVDEYDPIKDLWTSAPSMQCRRSTLGVAMLNDKIYAVGGFDGSTGLDTAEVLDMSKARGSSGLEWRPIASMSTRRSSVGVGVLDNLIYAVGGYDGISRQCLASVEVYDPKRDVWSRLLDMSARRSGAGVGVLNGLLYAVGGHDGPLVRRSVEAFNPETQLWTAISDMNCCRRNAGVVAHKGLLFVIGGDDGSTHLNSVEQYNPKNGTWTLLPTNLNIGRSYSGICVIDRPDRV